MHMHGDMEALTAAERIAPTDIKLHPRCQHDVRIVQRVVHTSGRCMRLWSVRTWNKDGQ